MFFQVLKESSGFLSIFLKSNVADLVAQLELCYS